MTEDCEFTFGPWFSFLGDSVPHLHLAPVFFLASQGIQPQTACTVGSAVRTTHPMIRTMSAAGVPGIDQEVRLEFLICLSLLSIYLLLSGSYFFDRKKLSPLPCGNHPRTKPDAAREQCHLIALGLRPALSSWTCHCCQEAAVWGITFSCLRFKQKPSFVPRG